MTCPPTVDESGAARDGEPGGVVDSAVVARRIRRVRERIDAAGGTDRVRIVAVTKGFGADVVRAAIEAGVVDLGESYAQEFVAKFDGLEPLPDAVRVHFIGRLQTNKVRMVAGSVDLYQSVDRNSLVDEIARRAPGASVLIQLDLSGEPTKGGCDPEAAPDLVARARDRGLDVRGLMGIGPTGPPEAARPGFVRLVELADDLGLEERSIGMSGDLEVAVSAGSTMVRIGRDLFGDRPGRPRPGPLHAVEPSGH